MADTQYDTDADGASPIKLSLKAHIVEGENGEGVQREEIKKVQPPVTCHKAVHKTVLIVGPSGTGKSTFVEVIQNPHYTAEARVACETKDASSHQLLFNIGGEYIMANFIDTPGFSSSDGRSNLELENLILKFTKQNVTSLNMVLVTVPFGKRITEGQAADVLECLTFLGPELRTITAILATNAEGRTAEQKKKWFTEVAEEEHTKRIVQFCKGGLFFTGMQTSDDPRKAARFESHQQRETARLVRKCNRNPVVHLTGEKFKKKANKFMVFESAAKDSLTLLRILPELQKLCVEALQMRQALIDLSAKVTEEKKDRYGASMNKLKEFKQEEVDKEVLEWSKYQTAVEKYVGEGNRLSEASHGALSLYIKLTTALREARGLKFDIDNLTEDSAESEASEGESDDDNPFGYGYDE